jgi:hypothetical protein
MYSVSLDERVMSPRLAFSRRAPSCTNAVRHGSLDDRGICSLSGAGVPDISVG